MMFPPSLSQAIIERSFRAENGELGLLLGDAFLFLDACQSDAVSVLGWELWLADHDWPPTANEPVLAKGLWCGQIPARGETIPGVLGDSGSLEDTRQSLASLDLGWIDPKWSRFLRVNITLE
jgi:hypothetical protein